MKDFILARLREASTWRGIIMVLTAAGIPIAPAMAETIIAVGMALVGTVGIVTPDSEPRNDRISRGR